jgi:hypothetical protein
MRVPAPDVQPGIIGERGFLATRSTGRLARRPVPLRGHTATGRTALGNAGRPLAESARQFFEPRLGANLDSVRVHTDARAASVAHAIDAQAFTVGTDIVFAAGQYAPDTARGRHLLAHELAHVLQERDDRQPSVLRKETEGPDCAGRVSDLYWLQAATCKPGIALIGRAGEPPGHTRSYRVGDSLDSMTIMDIPCVDRPSHSRVSVEHCGRHETLYAEPEQRAEDEALACGGHASDLFVLQSVMPVSPRTSSMAQIRRHDQSEERAEVYRIGQQLNEYMVIVDIVPGASASENEVVVAHCDRYEVLTVGQPGARETREESPSAPAPVPEQTDEVPENLGTMGCASVTHRGDCDTIQCNEPRSGGGPKVYIWDAPTEEYADREDRSKTFTAPGLSRILGVMTKVRESGKWVGSRCGEPIR